MLNRLLLLATLLSGTAGQVCPTNDGGTCDACSDDSWGTMTNIVAEIDATNLNGANSVTVPPDGKSV